MTHAVGAYLGGVRSVEDLLARSEVDELCGCWRWRLSMQDGAPKVHVVAAPGKRVIMRGRRAAAYVAGKRIRKGDVVYAHPDCPRRDCVNPAHALVGDRDMQGAAHRKSGRLRMLPSKIAAARKAWDKRGRRITPEMAAEIRSSTATIREMAERFGISQFGIWACRVGQTHRGAVTGASVFVWRP